MHVHKITEIVDEASERSEYGTILRAYHVKMDCPVQPEKVFVVFNIALNVGDEFDSHFSNDHVLGRFRPNLFGFDDAVGYVRTKAKKV
jgi:hypothetical protein